MYMRQAAAADNCKPITKAGSYYAILLTRQAAGSAYYMYAQTADNFSLFTKAETMRINLNNAADNAAGKAALELKALPSFDGNQIAVHYGEHTAQLYGTKADGSFYDFVKLPYNAIACMQPKYALPAGQRQPRQEITDGMPLAIDENSKQALYRADVKYYDSETQAYYMLDCIACYSIKALRTFDADENSSIAKHSRQKISANVTWLPASMRFAVTVDEFLDNVPKGTLEALRQIAADKAAADKAATKAADKAAKADKAATKAAKKRLTKAAK